MISCRKCKYLFDLYFECKRRIKVVVIGKASKNLLYFDDLRMVNLLRQLPFPLKEVLSYSLNRHLEIRSELKPVSASRNIYSLHCLLDNE